MKFQVTYALEEHPRSIPLEEKQPRLKILVLGFYLSNHSKKNDFLIGCFCWNNVYLLFKRLHQFVTATNLIKINSIPFNITIEIIFNQINDFGLKMKAKNQRKWVQS